MNNNPFEKVFDQIAELMQYAYDNANKPVPLKKQHELDEQLKQLEKNVEQLSKMSDEFVSQTGTSEYAIEAMLEDEKSEMVTKDDLILLKRAEELKQEAEKAAIDPVKAAEEAMSTGKRLSGKKKMKKPTSPTARKGKFKTQGGYKNWKPL